MLLTPDQEMIRDAVRDFVREQITPHAGTRSTTFPRTYTRGWRS